MQTWHEALGAEKEQPYFRHIIQSVRQEREAGRIIYPPAADVFNAFKATEFNQVKVVILAQDRRTGWRSPSGPKSTFRLRWSIYTKNWLTTSPASASRGTAACNTGRNRACCCSTPF